MNTNTKYNLRMSFPIISQHKWSNSGYHTIPSNYMYIAPGNEYPVNILYPTHIVKVTSSSPEYAEWISNRAIERIVYRGELKVMNDLFYSGFNRHPHFKKYVNAQNSYYLGQGIITDANFNPYIMVTYRLEDADLEPVRRSRMFNAYVPFDPERLKVYLSRKIFYPDFTSDNKRMSRELFNEIIPSLERLKLPMIVKEELDMFDSPYIDNSLNREALQIKFKQEIENIDEEILRDIFSNNR